jgi:hypothetical protein
MRSLGVALAALALAGCAGGEDEAAAPQSDDPAVLLAQAADRLREQATFSYTATYTRTRSDQPNDPLQYGETEGALDHAAKRGRMTLQFDLGLPELDDPITLRWNTAELEAEFGGHVRRMARRMLAEAWIDADGLPRRLSYTLRFPAIKALPARTVVGVYDLADFGEPVSGLEFKKQAG